MSNIGSWMQAVAVGALLISRTGQATWAVLVAAAAFLPIGLLAPVGGALADRVARRPVLIGGQPGRGRRGRGAGRRWSAAAASSPVVLVGLVAVQGSASAVIGPFQQAILPDLVPAEEFLPAIALNSAQFNLGRIAGPALAGATIAAFGYPLAFDANAVSFLAVVAALMFVRLAPPAGRGHDSLLASLRQGFAVARTEPSCWAAVVTIAVVALIASPFIALVPAMAERLSGGGARRRGLGHRRADHGPGHRRGGRRAVPGRPGRPAWAAAACWPAACRAARRADPLRQRPGPVVGRGRPCSRSALVYISVLSGLSAVVQFHAPSAYRGRVLSFYLVALGVAYPVGSLIQGPIVDRIGIGWTTTGTALLLWLVLGLAAATLPAARRALLLPAPVEHLPALPPARPARASR